MRILHRLAVATAAITPLFLLAPPAEALAAGHLTFEGDLTLSNVACGGCAATFNADLTVGTAVSSGGSWAIVTSLSANITYSQGCVDGVAVGSARGTATLSGTNIIGTLLPTTVPFNWQRVGPQAVIYPDPVTNTNPAVVGTAEFLLTTGAPCSGPATSLVVGEVTLVAIP